MEGLDSPETAQYLYVPAVFSGDRLIELGITTWEEFFRQAPPQFHIGKLYHVFIPGKEQRKYVTHGTITGIVSKFNGMNDQVKDIMNFPKQNESPAQTKFIREQLLEKDSEIKRLNQKVDEMTKELFQAKEHKIFAEQELRRTIGLNDAIQQKETEYLKAIEKAQKDQAESSNKILEGIFALASTGMQLWLNSQNQKNGGNSQIPTSPEMPKPSISLKDHVDNLSEGQSVSIKNKNGESENWTVKIVNDKKVIVNEKGQMKTF
jgi:hypothetical protein